MERQDEEFVCKNGAVWLTHLRQRGFGSDELSFGYETTAMSFQKALDGSLIAERRYFYLGFIGIVPVVGKDNYWFRWTLGE